MPGQYVVLRLQRSRQRPAALSQLLALGSPLDGALSNQREGRAEWGGRNLLAGACAGGRYSRRQLAARKLHSAVRRAAGGAAQRRNRSDAGSGDAVRAGGGALDTARLVAARSSRWRASSFRRRSSRPHASAPARPQLRLLQQARRRATRWVRISTRPVTFRDRSSRRSASHERRMSTSAGRLRFMAEMKEDARNVERCAGADSRRTLQRQ